MGHREILHFTTTKIFLEGKTVRFTGDSPEACLLSRRSLAEKLGVKITHLVFPRQTHSDQVACIQQISEEEFDGVDALITNQNGICLCVQTADCVPILLFDQKKKVIAAVHAGWRGTVNRIVAKTVAKMADSFHSSTSDIITCIGPSIGPQVYEVGQEVISQVEKNIPSSNKVLIKSSNKAFLNLWEANKNILLSSGLNEKNITISGLCSYSESRLFFSARRDGIHTGRMVSGIMLR